MLLDEAVNNLPMALFHATRLRELRALDPPASLNAVLQPLFGEGYQSQWEPANALRPALFIAGNNSRKVVWIDGATTAAQATALIDGYGGGTSFGAFNGKNQYLHDQADWILNRYETSALVKSEHLDFVGYSLGGAIAVLLKWKLVQSQSNYKSKVVTFGAPRSGNTQVISLLANSPIARYMTDADPIPLLPPRAVDVPALVPLLGALTLVRYSTFVHATGGVVLHPNGATSGLELPPIAAMNPAVSLAGWYLGQENDPANPHSLDRYVAYLQAAVNLTTTPAAQNVNQAPREQANETNRREMTRAERTTVNVINAQGQAQNSIPQVIPQATLFKAVRLGPIWYVEFGGEICITAPIEKRARHIARAGNDFLRSLQKQAVVDPITIVQQFRTFMELAADPTSGFSPTIKVGLDN
jgi:hypothetical protein